MKNLFLDVESVGLCGPTKLIQFAVDDSDVAMIPLYRGWKSDSAIRGYLGRLYDILNAPDVCFVAYNAAFDLFKLYLLFHEFFGGDLHESRRIVPPFACSVLDLYVPAARNGPLSAFAFAKGKSKSIAAVRRIPIETIDTVASAVEARITPMLPASVRLVRGIKEVKENKLLKTVVWTVDGRMSLKNLMREYGLPTMKLEEVWPLPPKGSEKPWLPYPDPSVHDPVEVQCEEVMRNPESPFWKYSELDIWYLKVLYEKLGRPEPDHISACIHSTVYARYYGFPLNRKVLLATKEAYTQKLQSIETALSGVNLKSPKQRLAFLRKDDPLVGSSKKSVLQVLADSDRPSAKAAKLMLNYGPMVQRVNQIEHVLECATGRAHPSLRIPGTKTWRAAGESGVNWQGIPQAKNGLGIRAAMSAPAVGDWSQFEVAISADAFPDSAVAYDLEHAIDAHVQNAVLMHPEARRAGWDYETMKRLVEVGDEKAKDLRKRMKPVTFKLNYFGQTIHEQLGVSQEEGEKALENYYSHYQGFAAYRKRCEQETMTADTDHWNPESVKRMKSSITDMTGCVLRWDFEAMVADVLWRLGGEGIRTGKQGMVLRSQEKGKQTFDGAVKSALLGAAIAIQAAVARQRGNGKVQATGANLNQMLMANLWNRYRYATLNVHDEHVFVPVPWFNFIVATNVVHEFEQEWKPVIKALHFDFHETRVWANKK